MADTARLVYDEHDVRRTFTPCKHQSRTSLYVVNLIVVSYLSTKAQLFFMTLINPSFPSLPPPLAVFPRRSSIKVAHVPVSPPSPHSPLSQYFPVAPPLQSHTYPSLPSSPLPPRRPSPPSPLTSLAVLPRGSTVTVAHVPVPDVHARPGSVTRARQTLVVI